MEWKELPKNVMEAAGRFTEAQLEARRLRLADPETQRSLQEAKESLNQSLQGAGVNALKALARYFITPVPMAVAGLVTGPVNIARANDALPKDKRSNPLWGVLKGPPKAFLGEYWKGTGNILLMLKDLGVAAGKTTLLGARYTVGK